MTQYAATAVAGIDPDVCGSLAYHWTAGGLLATVRERTDGVFQTPQTRFKGPKAVRFKSHRNFA